MEIPAIKQRLKITTVLQHYGLSADKNGMLLCPFHADTNKSLKIYTETNTFNCFGCGANGDVIEFIQQKEASTSSATATKHKAILKAKELLNQAPTMKTPPTTKPQELPTENLPQLFATFRNSLAKSKPAQEYLKQRCLDGHQLEVGFNGGTTHKQLKKCVVFPLKDTDNKIVSLYGRSIDNKAKGRHYYLANRKGLYPSHPDAATEVLILTESIIDAATLLKWKIESGKLKIDGTSILACYGTNGFTEEHEAAVKSLERLKELIIFFDGDKQGEEGAKALATRLKETIHCSISIADCLEGEDINSLAQSHEAEIFGHLLKERKAFPLTEQIEKAEKTEGEPTKAPEPQPQPAESFNTANPDFIVYKTSELSVTVLGGINLQQLDRLKVTLKIEAVNETNFSGTVRNNNLDLYNLDQLDRFVQKASEKLEIGSTVLSRALDRLTDKLERYRMAKTEALKKKAPKKRELTKEREQAAIDYLKQPNLHERTNLDIGKTGIVGEENNRMTAWYVFTSRLRKSPLHLICLGASGTGKTYLQEKVSELIPDHEKLEITILSENAFYYFEQTELKHKLVLIEDLDGATDVLYPLRELQSKKRITKRVPLKDSKGNLKTVELQVEGPICLAGTTTMESLYEDNANRSLLIYLDTGKEQQSRIMEYQRKLSAGKINAVEETRLKEFFKDIQTVLKPVEVRNPYAEQLALPDHVFKPLRTNAHYLSFIETVTFYHQYQRKLVTTDSKGNAVAPHIETAIEDIEIANRLMKDVLLSKSDELTRNCRKVFERIKNWLEDNGKESFYTKEIRGAFRMNPNNLKYYLAQLARYNYLKTCGGNRHRGFEYQIVDTKEYQALNRELNNALDEALERAKEYAKRVGRVDNSG